MYDGTLIGLALVDCTSTISILGIITSNSTISSVKGPTLGAYVYLLICVDILSAVQKILLIDYMRLIKD